MKNFLTNLKHFAIIGFIPLFLLFIVYLILDPFKVIKSYDTFYDINAKGRVGLNKDYISTTTFIKNYKKQNYDSFVFGSSRSMVYQISDWRKYLSPQSHCFHFNASSEILYGLQKKIEYIDSKGIEIKNALLVLDHSTFEKESNSGHLWIISPALVGNSNILNFHFTFFKAFLSPKFLYAYLDFVISGKIKPYMTKNHLLEGGTLNYDVSSNEHRWYDFSENMINNNESAYYTKERLSVFYKRDTLLKYSPISIRENQKKMLNDIQRIFNKHKTNYRIVISPLYDQLKLNKTDLEYLENVFGKDNVFDFSGINTFTQDYTNYYEDSHYRPHVARKIMEKIYEHE
ncbi:hypothetical protein EZS27_028503 [termite gut metagenome]|uniref:Uncharacterized protein n=1 Tax=termite gut metagenome TaxID=433724 RepID=A0A5J4QKR0_9ZZZZ